MNLPDYHRPYRTRIFSFALAAIVCIIASLPSTSNAYGLGYSVNYEVGSSIDPLIYELPDPVSAPAYALSQFVAYPLQQSEGTERWRPAAIRLAQAVSLKAYPLCPKDYMPICKKPL